MNKKRFFLVVAIFIMSIRVVYGDSDVYFRLFKNGDIKQKRFAIRILGNRMFRDGEIGNDEIEKRILWLIRSLAHGDYLIRYYAKESLIRFGKKGYPKIFECLKSEDIKIKKGCIEVLWKLGILDGNIKEIGRKFVDLLRFEKEVEIRKELVIALGKIRYSNGVNILIGMLRSRSWEVRAESAKALGLIEDKRSIEPLINYGIHDRNSFVRIYAAGALGRLKSKRAVPSLIKALKKNYSEGKQTIVWSLGKIGDKKASEILMYILNQDRDHLVRREAKKALRNMGYLLKK